MSVKIRLQKTGKRDRTTFRIVAIDESSKRDGKVLSFLGSYNPHVTPPATTLNKDKLSAWLKKGAIPTAAVKQLIK